MAQREIIEEKKVITKSYNSATQILKFLIVLIAIQHFIWNLDQFVEH